MKKACKIQVDIREVLSQLGMNYCIMSMNGIIQQSDKAKVNSPEGNIDDG